MSRPSASTRAGRAAGCTRAAAALALLFACGGPPPVDPGLDPAVDPDPPAANADASSAEPALPEAEAARYACAADYSAAHTGRALLVLRGEAVVFEAGQNGHTVDVPHPIYSASETFWGLAGVAAESDGLLDLDEPVALTIEEFERDDAKRDVRVRQLLDLSSGIEPGVAALRREQTPNLTERALALDMISRPGRNFQYGPSHVTVFVEVLRRKLEPQGDTPLGYLRAKILEPIGSSLAGWDRDDAGNPDAAYGAQLAPREWAKVGILLENRGSWQGREVLAPDAFEQLVRGSEASPEYGLGLWRNLDGAGAVRTFYPGALPDMLVSAGAGNQRLYVIPSLDLVVVRLGEPDRRWRDREFLACLVKTPHDAPEAPAAGISDLP